MQPEQTLLSPVSTKHIIDRVRIVRIYTWNRKPPLSPSLPIYTSHTCGLVCVCCFFFALRRVSTSRRRRRFSLPDGFLCMPLTPIGDGQEKGSPTPNRKKKENGRGHPAARISIFVASIISFIPSLFLSVCLERHIRSKWNSNKL